MEQQSATVTPVSVDPSVRERLERISKERKMRKEKRRQHKLAIREHNPNVAAAKARKPCKYVPCTNCNTVSSKKCRKSITYHCSSSIFVLETWIASIFELFCFDELCRVSNVFQLLSCRLSQPIPYARNRNNQYRTNTKTTT